ncbi:MAG: LamG domain-containing protein [Phycisphaerae bacterium]
MWTSKKVILLVAMIVGQVVITATGQEVTPQQAKEKEDRQKAKEEEDRRKELAHLRMQLLAYWELDGNADDSTDHKRHLEVHPSNDQHWGPGLRGSQALELFRDKGTSYAVRQGSHDDGEFDFHGAPFTIQAWAKFKNLDHEQVIVEKVDKKGGWTLTKLPDQRIRFHAGPIYLSSDVAALDTTKWHQFIVRRWSAGASHMVEVFLDKKQIASQPLDAAASIGATERPLLVGKRDAQVDKDLNRFIDDLAIWSRGLSEAERLRLWGNGQGIDILP